jgi:DNA-binding CsgD family transcriptional regulator
MKSMTTHDTDQANCQNNEAGRHFGLLGRFPGHLRALPLKYRWEITRRHPYYLMAWESTCQTIMPGEADLLMQEAHRVILGAIGVSGPMVAPDTPFDALVSQNGESPPAWLSHSVQPLTLRGLTGLLLAHLSAHTRNQLAELFRSSVDGGEDRADCLIQALLHLQTLESTDLDSFADQPIVAISPHLTVNALTVDIRTFLNEWRDRHGIAEQRVRADKFDEYFAVWDAREGWTGAGYELGDNRRLIEVARRLGITPTTARNQYYAAFELITGHRYSVANWLRVCGPVKYPTDLIVELNETAFRRRVQTRGTRAPVPESVLTSNEDNARISDQIQAENDDAAIWELQEDFQTLLRLGRTDMEIAQELEIRLETVCALKFRIEELSQVSHTPD